MFQIQDFSEFREKFYSSMTAKLNEMKLPPSVSRGKCNIGRGESRDVAYLETRVLVTKREKTIMGVVVKK